jgi:hypothetical protein
MANKTGTITFNVTERGRKFRGQERNFDTAVLAQLINSAEVQEKVSHGDMVGYLGHWPRIKFGMNPSEGGIVDGKAVALEPAIRTVRIKAYPDGTIEHEAEFLDTAPGKMAARMHASKTGGFSSAIDTRRIADKQSPTGFYGFDYVLEPNYTHNRGYAMALDGVFDDESVFDAISEQQQLVAVFDGMFDQVQQAYDSLKATLDTVLQENEGLIDRLAMLGGKKETTLDSASCLVNVVHGRVKGHALDDADSFLSDKLEALEKPKDLSAKDPVMDAVGDLLDKRFGFI